MYTNEKQADIEINLLDLLRFVWTRWAVVLAAAVLCAVIGFLMPVSVTAGSWEASGSLMLYADDLQVTEGISPTAEKEKLTNVAAALISGSQVYADALEIMDSDQLPAELAQYVTVSTKTQLIHISVKHSNPVFARNAAEAIRAAAPAVVAERLPGVRLQAYGTIGVTGTEGGTGSHMSNVVLGGVLGAVLAVLLIVLAELLNTTVKSRRELEQLTGAPVLGAMPTVRSSERESARAIRKAGRV
ncbi:MAG: hypothetical protein IJY28_06175 [Clostridia bacterium]|nr:hypothetical protein [Clostridia bacterium]